MAVTDTNTDVLTIADTELSSRLLLGTGGVPSRLTEGDLEDLFAPLAD